MIDSFRKRLIKSFANLVKLMILLVSLMQVVSCRDILPFLTSPTDGIYELDIEMLLQTDMDEVVVSNVISNLQVVQSEMTLVSGVEFDVNWDQIQSIYETQWQVLYELASPPYIEIKDICEYIMNASDGGILINYPELLIGNYDFDTLTGRIEDFAYIFSVASDGHIVVDSDNNNMTRIDAQAIFDQGYDPDKFE